MNLEETKLEIYQMAICGASSAGVNQKLLEAGLDQEQIAAVFTDTLDRLRKLADIDLDVEKGRAVARFEMIFLNCIRGGDFPTALKAQKEIIDLLDLKKYKLASAPKSIKLESWKNG